MFKVNLPPNEDRILLGVNLAHFKKILRPVKKKETIELIKETASSTDLCIKISPKELGGEVDVNFIKIQEIQILDLELPNGYDEYISIPTSRYQKMCKDMESISQNIHIESNNGMVKFTSDMTGVYSRSILFGKEDSGPVTYSQIFESEQLNNLGRISGLGANTNSNIQVFTKDKLPMLLRTNVGTLGKLNIYIKSKEQIEAEGE
jgi:proliferating cell nuclear antigen